MLGGALIGAVIGYFFDGTIIPLTVGYALLSCAIILSVLFAESGRPKAQSSETTPA